MARHDGHPGRGRGGGAFTLVELLTVVAIIGLLVGLIVPTLKAILETMVRVQTKVRIENLANGAYSYKMDATDNRYFPGQQYYTVIQTSKMASGYLAACLFTDANGVFPVSAYGAYEDDMRATIGGDPNAIADTYSDRMAILYFPANKEKTIVSEQFVTGALSAGASVNGAYLTSQTLPVTLINYLTDANSVKARKGEFILVGAGKDRLYFTADDIKNF